MYLFANWKMNLSVKETLLLVKQYKELETMMTMKVAVFPDLAMAASVAKLFKGTGIAVGAQDSGPLNKGPFTGSVSPRTLLDIGCAYALVGHSEHRKQGETDDVIRQKLEAAGVEGLVAVLCVGEPLDEHQAGRSLDYVRNQLKENLEGVHYPVEIPLFIAYEPIWAIGSGATPSPAEVDGIAERIVSQVKSYLPGRKVEVLYGGSVTGDNVNDFLKQPSLSGCLVGNASQEIGQWRKLLETVTKLV
ncbi:MAG: triose-phosphate isomerase family protein [bacterium]